MLRTSMVYTKFRAVQVSWFLAIWTWTKPENSSFDCTLGVYRPKSDGYSHSIFILFSHWNGLFDGYTPFWNKSINHRQPPDYCMSPRYSTIRCTMFFLRFDGRVVLDAAGNDLCNIDFGSPNMPNSDRTSLTFCRIDLPYTAISFIVGIVMNWCGKFLMFLTFPSGS